MRTEKKMEKMPQRLNKRLKMKGTKKMHCRRMRVEETEMTHKMKKIHFHSHHHTS